MATETTLKNPTDSVLDELILEIDIGNRIALLEKLVLEEDETNSMVQTKEKAISHLAKLYIQTKNTLKINDFLKHFEKFFRSIPKAKTAKIVRGFLNTISSEPDTLDLQLVFCEESIAWCIAQNLVYLRQRIENRKAEILYEKKKYREALEVLKNLSAEVKKVDDKLFLIEVSLLESQIHSDLGYLPVAKSSLVIARTTSNMVYCPTDLQAKLDFQSGNVALIEKDYKSSFSYYFEAYEGYDFLKDRRRAIKPLKYMLLSKMLSDKTNEVASIVKGKIGAKYCCRELDSILRISEAYKKRSLREFKTVLNEYEAELKSDSIVNQNLQRVQEDLLEKNILHVIKPYSNVEIEVISQAVEVDIKEMETILSKMILDKKIRGVIDQFKGHLIIDREEQRTTDYENALKIIEQLDITVTKLAKTINMDYV